MPWFRCSDRGLYQVPVTVPPGVQLALALAGAGRVLARPVGAPARPAGTLAQPVDALAQPVQPPSTAPDRPDHTSAARCPRGPRTCPARAADLIPLPAATRPGG